MQERTVSDARLLLSLEFLPAAALARLHDRAELEAYIGRVRAEIELRSAELSGACTKLHPPATNECRRGVASVRGSLLEGLVLGKEGT